MIMSFLLQEIKKNFNFCVVKLKENRGSFENRISDIKALKQELNKAKRSIAEKDKQLHLLEDKLRQKDGDKRKLIEWLDQIIHGVSIILNSKRWYLGNKIGNLFRKIKLKTPNPKIEDFLFGIIENYRDWSKFEESQIANFKFQRGIKFDIASKNLHKKELKYNDVWENKKSKFHQIIREVKEKNQDKRFIEQINESEQLIQNYLSAGQRQTPTDLFTIIMPAYNRSHIVKESIQSVLDQVYKNWELWVCDDGSKDNLEDTVRSFNDIRIKYKRCGKVGAAQARNIGLSCANGKYISYLDSDNIWHPQFLNLMICCLTENKAKYSAYSKYIDISIRNNSYHLNGYANVKFDYESLLKMNFLDLNSFVHIKELNSVLGGFNLNLKRLQDYDLILKYCFLKDPYFINAFLTIYQRNEMWAQISKIQEGDQSSVNIIRTSTDNYFKNGLPILNTSSIKHVTVLSWDICRNHFSKAYNIAECLSKHFKVQLVGFKFFNSNIFFPYKNEKPHFETLYLKGSQFPDFKNTIDNVLKKISGEIIYAVKPRLPSFGLALLANYYHNIPFILEINDMESLVSDPVNRKIDQEFTLASIDFSNNQLLNPFSDIWSKIMEKFAYNVPYIVTHNKNVDSFFGSKCFFIRNLKNEKYYSPENYSRDKIRRDYGFSDDDRIILFGGMIRKHKGVYELIKLIKRLNDSRYKLLFVGSRKTRDQRELSAKYGHIIKLLPPQSRNEMAKITFAADLVIIWLDPTIEASHFQMPYKLTDAFAMKVPVIANDISDLSDFGRNGYLRLVNYGDFDKAIYEIERIFAEPEKTIKMTDRARRLYMRQFSYNATNANFQIISNLIANSQNINTEISENFANLFGEFVSYGSHFTR